MHLIINIIKRTYFCVLMKLYILYLRLTYVSLFSGKHHCLGQSLAKSNIFLSFACLLQNFYFSIPAGQAPPSTLGIDGITPSPGEVKAYVSLRSWLAPLDIFRISKLQSLLIVLLIPNIIWFLNTLLVLNSLIVTYVFIIIYL